jgi:nitrite reductase/ring-hydroxylating ferredoxin subunit
MNVGPETRSHFTGPLSEEKLVDNCIECPYHASRFDLQDGHVVNGPAVHAHPCLELRAGEGQIEVRKAPLPKP